MTDRSVYEPDVTDGIGEERKSGKRISRETRDEIIRLIGEGRRNGEIASALGIKAQTVADLKKRSKATLLRMDGRNIDGTPAKTPAKKPEARNAPANPTERPAQRPAKPEESSGNPARIDLDKILALAESGRVSISIQLGPDGTRIDIIPWEV